MSASRLAKRYAKALFSLGQENDSYIQYGQELSEFANLCQDNVDFGNVVANPAFAIEDRKKVLDFVLEKRIFSSLAKRILHIQMFLMNLFLMEYLSVSQVKISIQIVLLMIIFKKTYTPS